MTELTKEWLLRTIADLEEERDAVPGVVNEDAAMALAAMKLALASLEADSKLSDFVASQESLGVEFEGVLTENIEELYVPSKSTPPAPVSDSLLSELLAIAKKAADAADECAHAEWSDDSMEHSTAIADWERRAAMLQGAENAESPTTMQTSPSLDSSQIIAESPTGINQCKSEPVTTAYKLPFEQWLSQQTGTIDVECGCVMTEVFFHWLRVAYEAGNTPMIPDGWVMVPVEPTEHMIVEGFESEPDEFFSDEEVWEAYDAMSGCQQAAHRAKICWAAMIKAAPKLE